MNNVILSLAVVSVLGTSFSSAMASNSFSVNATPGSAATAVSVDVAGLQASGSVSFSASKMVGAVKKVVKTTKSLVGKTVSAAKSLVE